MSPGSSCNRYGAEMEFSHFLLLGSKIAPSALPLNDSSSFACVGDKNAFSSYAPIFNISTLLGTQAHTKKKHFVKARRTLSLTTLVSFHLMIPFHLSLSLIPLCLHIAPCDGSH
mmetsp:Transcript_1904/g.6815  ORF Transcript_1904/g.6815 Transcript_1904/m.6815 type:complete len:114 (-) Transcript_1904:55-396(-)